MPAFPAPLSERNDALEEKTFGRITASLEGRVLITPSILVGQNNTRSAHHGLASNTLEETRKI